MEALTLSQASAIAIEAAVKVRAEAAADPDAIVVCRVSNCPVLEFVFGPHAIDNMNDQQLAQHILREMKQMGV